MVLSPNEYFRGLNERNVSCRHLLFGKIYPICLRQYCLIVKTEKKKKGGHDFSLHGGRQQAGRRNTETKGLKCY